MSVAFPPHAQRWAVFEVSLSGPTIDDPLRDAPVSAVFTCGTTDVEVHGFYDGDGRYLVRFSPDQVGEWSFRTFSEVAELEGHEGRFRCSEPDAANHGPVDVASQFHFGYRDGTRYVPVGTTCYAWIHQPIEVQEQTLRSLEASPFNKLRMCVFPKDYIYNENEPPLHPYTIGEDGRIDPRQPNLAYFGHLDKRIAELGDLGIEADIILFHPYDRWGYCEMSEEDDLAYLRYVVARLGAHRNVWWSLANEYDFLLDLKPVERWERFFEVVRERDPHGRLTSIHNGHKLYDHSRPEISHVSIQSQRIEDTTSWRDDWGKPVVNDEPQYEGDIPDPWGNISPRELVHRFWMTATRGGYAGHGETYLVDDHQLWWAKGGTLRGESPARIAFLRRIMEESPGPWEPLKGRWEWGVVGGCEAGSGERIIYFGSHQPQAWFRGFPDGRRDISVETIDPWAMTIEPLVLTDPPHFRYPATSRTRSLRSSVSTCQRGRTSRSGCAGGRSAPGSSAQMIEPTAPPSLRWAVRFWAGLVMCWITTPLARGVELGGIAPVDDDLRALLDEDTVVTIVAERVVARSPLTYSVLHSYAVAGSCTDA